MAAPLSSDKAEVVDGTILEPAEAQPETKKTDNEKLVAWVMDRVTQWREHRNANYEERWNTYERLWRGIWAGPDQNREKERSRIVSPALSEAVENAVSEIEEGVFGRGDFFDLGPESKDSPQEKEALKRNEVQFREDLSQTDFTEQCAAITINGAVYGTGIGEVVHVTETKYDMEMGQPPIDPETGQPMGPPELKVRDRAITRPCLKSVNPRNFIPDPSANRIVDMLGCAIEEDVGAHRIREGIENGEYMDVGELLSGSSDPRHKADPQMENPWVMDVVPVIRYYGKVPHHLLFPPESTESLFEDEEEPAADAANADMVEAVIVIANGSQLLQAEETRDLMKDRPVVSLPWDLVPGRFWGRGICEKGVTPQKLLDAELRARIDALAYVAAPMMAMDASRLPRGFKLEVYPGKNVLLAGNPEEILKPFKFGELDQNSAQQVEMLDRMVQRATGSIDAAQMAQAGAGGEARSGAVSMAMSGIVKRNKRTLMRYVNSFLGPVLRKLLVRYMQYDQERYVPMNFSFNISSTMGIMQREYETMALTQLMNAMQPGTSEHMIILRGIVQNSGMQDREAILELLNKRLAAMIQAEMNPPPDPNAAPPVDPIMQQLQQQQIMVQLMETNAKIAKLHAETLKIRAEAQNEALEPMFKQQEIALRGIYQTPEEQVAAEFDRRMEVADVLLREREMESDERIAEIQREAALGSAPQPNIDISVERPVVDRPIVSPVPMKRA